MTKDLVTLLQMLQYRRPDNSETEKQFIKRYIEPVAPNMDGYGNYYVTIGENPRVLWSSHTDTVHRGIGMQTPTYDDKDQCIKLHPSVPSSCLGADCGAGIFIMLEMIKAEIPGLYIFHRNEENGGGGSRYIAKECRTADGKTTGLLVGIEAAIAFDRRGKDSVITHMWSGRTCSDAFANSMIALLPASIDEGGVRRSIYRFDTGGSFTDTASYKEIVPECTNLSVGYEGAHGSNESLHVPTLLKLRDAMLLFDQNAITIERDPKAVPFVEAGGRYRSEWPRPLYNGWTPPQAPEPDIAVAGGTTRKRTKFDIAPGKQRNLGNLCMEKPWLVSRLLEFWELTYEDVIASLVMLDECKRKDVDASFVKGVEPTVERVFREQLRRQAGEDPSDPDPADEIEALQEEDQSRHYLRGAHALTDEEWREHDAMRQAVNDKLLNGDSEQPPLALPKPH